MEQAVLIRGVDRRLVAAFDAVARAAERSREAHLRYLIAQEVARARAERRQARRGAAQAEVRP